MESSLKSGYVAVVGRPNVGKSTLINTLLGQKVAAVSPRPQTTRRKQLGVLTMEKAQVILVDTPGIHLPFHRLGELMNRAAVDALADADLILWLVDSSSEPQPEDLICAKNITSLRALPAVILVMNKIDLVPANQLITRQTQFMELLPGVIIHQVSSSRGMGISALLEEIIHRLPEGEFYFPEDQVTDFYERDIAVELIREAALIYLRDEVPHCLAVRLDEYKDRDQHNSYIQATLFVEKDSQKGIVIGKGGEMLKKIGMHARGEIERMSGRKVFLELRVKVSQNWRNDEQMLRMIGFSHED